MIYLNDSVFEKIFPFFVRIDKHMTIKSSGTSIKKVIGNVDGKSFKEVFKFIDLHCLFDMNLDHFWSIKIL